MASYAGFATSGLDAVLLILLGIVIMLVGRGLAGLAVGVVLGLVLGACFYHAAGGLGFLVALLSSFLGFMAGLALGLVVPRFASSLAAGILLAVYVAGVLALGYLPALLLSIAFTVVFYYASRRAPGAARAAAGALLVYHGLAYWVPGPPAAVAALVAAAIGLGLQVRERGWEG